MGTVADRQVWKPTHLAAWFVMKFKFAIFLFLLLPSAIGAQLTSGIISSARATDWTGAGVIGGIPSASWSQCGSTVAAGTSAATINTLWAACSANTYLLLGPGTFNLTAVLTCIANVALRGSGANSTFLVFGAAVTPPFISCAGGSVSAFTAWTGGYSQGSTSITVTSAAGVSANTSFAILDQCEDGLSDDNCATGTSTDTGNLFNCTVIYNATGPVGCSVTGNGSEYAIPFRYQSELVQVTNVAGNTLTLQRGIKNPNFASGQTPHAQFFTPIQNTGVENLSIDGTAVGFVSSQFSIKFTKAANVWVSGVRIINSPHHAIGLSYGVHATVKDTYISYSNRCNFGSCAGVPSRTALYELTAADNLFQNNIIQGYFPAYSAEGPSSGSVLGYNLFINGYLLADNLPESFVQHSGGVSFTLYEGNIAPILKQDITHGTETMNTIYRNLLTGWDSCANSQCGASTTKDSETNGILLSSYARYYNVVANVLGTPTYTVTYSGTNINASAFNINLGNGQVPNDTLVGTTLMRWGNYDIATGAVRWCGNSSDTGWSTTCASTSEVPTGASTYPNTVPTLGDTGGAMPASFYLSARPSWFGSTPWPAIGPEVTSGNLGVCSGTINTSGHYSGMPAMASSQCTGTSLTASAWAGHANAIPALNCFLTVMGGTPDGTTAPLTFNPTACYGLYGTSLSGVTGNGVTIHRK